MRKRFKSKIARRRFLTGVAGTAAGLLARGGALAQTDANAHLAVAYEDAGLPIPPDFVGLSYESAILAAGDYFTPDNASVLGLIGLLGADGLLRIGGNTSERTVWRAGNEAAAPDSFVITPANIDRLAATLRILGWKLIYGLNLARGTPETAAAEAAYVAGAVGGNLLAFQIGNEPDGFGRWTALRPKTYDAPAFLAEVLRGDPRACPRRAFRRPRRRRRNRLGRRLRRDAARRSRPADPALLRRWSRRRTPCHARKVAARRRRAGARAG